MYLLQQKNPNPDEMKSKVLSLLRVPDGNWIQLAHPTSQSTILCVPSFAFFYSFLQLTGTICVPPSVPSACRGARAARHPLVPSTKVPSVCMSVFLLWESPSFVGDTKKEFFKNH